MAVPKPEVPESVETHSPQAPVVQMRRFQLNWKAGGDFLKESAGCAAGVVGLPLCVYDFWSQWQNPMSGPPLASLAGVGLLGAAMYLYPAAMQAERRRKMWIGGTALGAGAALCAGAAGLWGTPLALAWMGVKTATVKAVQITALALPMTWIGGTVAGAIAGNGRKYIKRGKPPGPPPGQTLPSDLVLGIDSVNPDEQVVLLESDRYMHVMIVGPTGSGKTATSLSPMIVQDLANPNVGATVVEPKGDWILGVPGERDGIKQWGEKLGRTVYVIDPDNEHTDVYNPMYGDMHMVAESICTALRSLFQTKASFFADVQEALLKHVIYLLKWLKGDNVTFRDLHRVIGDYAMILSLSRELASRNSYWERVGFPDHMTEDDREELTKLVEWFRRETTGEQGEKLREVTLGVRVQLDNMMANKYFRRCIIPDSKPKLNDKGNAIGRRVIDLDRHLANNSILCVSTNDGLLAGMSQVLGKLILSALQHAASRRFKQPISKRRPHTVYVDEAPTYLTPAWSDFQAKARGFNVSIVLALQTIYQFEKVERGFTQTIVGNSRTRILYGGLPREDVEYWAGAFGTRQETEVSTSTNERTVMVPDDPILYPLGVPKQHGSGKTERVVDKELLAFNDLYWMDRGMALVQMVKRGNVQKPVKVQVGLVKQLPDALPGERVSPEAGLAIYSPPPLPPIPDNAHINCPTGGKGDGEVNDVDEQGRTVNKGSYTEADARRDAEAARSGASAQAKGNPGAKSVLGRVGANVEAPPMPPKKGEGESPASQPEKPGPEAENAPEPPKEAEPAAAPAIEMPPVPPVPKVPDNVRPSRPEVRIPTREDMAEPDALKDDNADEYKPFDAEPREPTPRGRPLPKSGTSLGKSGVEAPPPVQKKRPLDSFPKNQE